MGLFDITAVLLVLMAGYAFLNERYLHLPIVLGLLLMALLWSLLLLLLGWFEQGGSLVSVFGRLREQTVYDSLLSSLLGLLLFAGALRLNLADLIKQTWFVLTLPIFNVVLSVFLTGTLAWLFLVGLDVDITWQYGLLFGALIAPVDAVVVRGLMKRAGITGELQHRLAGESVLCGGLAIIVFLVLLTLTSTTDTTMLLSEKLLWQIGGSLLLGLLTGLGAYRLLRQLDDYQVEVLILLALVFGLLALAQHWFLYGPLALLSAGLVLGNHGQILAMSEKSRRHLHDFWELIGGLVNAVLLVLLMLEFLVIAPRFEFFLASLAILPAVLLARFIAMGVPVTVMRYFQAQAPGSVQIMTWGGLRGGISIALVLSLPAGIERDVFVMITAVIVIFSVLVQGLTFRSLVRHLGE